MQNNMIARYFTRSILVIFVLFLKQNNLKELQHVFFQIFYGLLVIQSLVYTSNLLNLYQAIKHTSNGQHYT